MYIFINFDSMVLYEDKYSFHHHAIQSIEMDMPLITSHQHSKSGAGAETTVQPRNNQVKEDAD